MTPEERECLIVLAEVSLRLIELPASRWDDDFVRQQQDALMKVQRLMYEANQQPPTPTGA